MSPAILRVGLIGLVGLAGCAEPERPTDVESDPVVTEDPIEEPDARAELLDQLAVVRNRLGEVQDGLAQVQEASSIREAGEGADRALTALVVGSGGARDRDNQDDSDAEESPDTTDDGQGEDRPEDPVPALLPSQTLERSESASAPDLLSATLTLAGDIGGELGRDVADVLRDPIAGDLGAWQRDPAGMVDLAAEVAGSSADLARLEPRIRELEGEGTRALAWIFVAAGTDDLELARGAAERARAHVHIMIVAVDDVGGPR